MAILQLSRITHRKGYTENLPQLAGAEFGWALDERRLFIGNGKIKDGAPVVGNTELLTEYSNLFEYASTYTYKGTEAGYVVQTGPDNTNITRSLQTKLDEYVSVRDFGAVGDGVVDDTDAINRAFHELFCIEKNTRVRRSLYFPAGTYKVTDIIKIPPFAKVYGDGLTSSIIKYYKLTDIPIVDYVVEMTDSLQQIGVNIGNNNATRPTGVEISSMAFTSNERNSILKINGLTDSSFECVNLSATTTISDITSPDFTDTTSIITINNSSNVYPNNLTFSKCLTSGATYGLNVENNCKGIQFENSKLESHYIGVNFNNPSLLNTGVIISRNIFDNIAYHGIYIEFTQMVSSAFNVFYNVGNNLTADPSIPSVSVISINHNNNTSIGDLFLRSDIEAETSPRIELNGKAAIGFDSAHAIFLGNYKREVGLETTLANDSSEVAFTLNSNTLVLSFAIDYTMIRNGQIRNGNVNFSTSLDDKDSYAIQFSDDYTESSGMGKVDLSAELTFSDSRANGVKVILTSDDSSKETLFKYSIVRLD